MGNNTKPGTTNNNNNTPQQSSYLDLLLFSITQQQLDAYLSSKKTGLLNVSDSALINSSLKKAIKHFKNAISNNLLLSPTQIRFIFKKFQQNRKWGLNPDADQYFIAHVKMIYDFIIKLNNSLASNRNNIFINKMHALMIDFYCEHAKHFNKNNRNAVLENAEFIFTANLPRAKDVHTFAAVVRAYSISDRYDEAHDFIWSESNVNHHGLHHEHNLFIINKNNGLIAAINYYEELQQYDNQLLPTYVHRQMLDLILDEIKLLQNEIYQENKKYGSYYKYSIKDKNKCDIVYLTGVAINIYNALPFAQINDQVFRAMLKILIKTSPLHTIQEFFNRKPNITLRDATYWQMIKSYWKNNAKYQASKLLREAYNLKYFPKNQPKLKNNVIELDLHEHGTTGGGKSYYGGKDAWSLPLLIHNFFQRILEGQFANEVTSKGVLPVKLISGVGEGVLKAQVIKILEFYGLSFTPAENNEGALILNINYNDFHVNKKLFSEFYAPEDGCYWCIAVKNKNIFNSTFTHTDNLQQYLTFFTIKKHNSSFIIFNSKKLTQTYAENKISQKPSFPGDNIAGIIALKMNYSVSELNILLNGNNNNIAHTIYPHINSATTFEVKEGQLDSKEINLSALQYDELNNNNTPKNNF